MKEDVVIIWFSVNVPHDLCPVGNVHVPQHKVKLKHYIQHNSSLLLFEFQKQLQPKLFFWIMWRMIRIFVKPLLLSTWEKKGNEGQHTTNKASGLNFTCMTYQERFWAVQGPFIKVTHFIKGSCVPSKYCRSVESKSYSSCLISGVMTFINCICPHHCLHPANC